MSDYISELGNAIKRVCGHKAIHVETVSVKEVFQGEVAWEGEVEVFDLVDFDTAKQCFAWGVWDEKYKNWKVTSVYAVPPVTSPQLAVKAAIAAHAQDIAGRQNRKAKEAAARRSHKP